VLSFADADVAKKSFPELNKLNSEIEIRTARWTLAQLEKHQAEAVSLANGLGFAVDSDIDVRKNQVEIYVEEDRATSALWSAARQFAPSVVLVGVEGLIRPLQLNGGQTLDSCTGGFTVRHNTGDLGIVTAGHCPRFQVAQGIELPFRAEAHYGSFDTQWHSACGLLDVSDDFKSGLGDRDVTGIRTRDQQTIGAFICKFGMISGRTCGTLQSKSVGLSTVPASNFTFMRLNGATGAEGDSGGPVYVESLAYGTTVGGLVEDGDIVYMAINYISTLGVLVLTTDPPGPDCNICSPNLCGGNRPPCCSGTCTPSGLGGIFICE
jgi:hypothetical protein